jgi:hypothetical protein
MVRLTTTYIKIVKLYYFSLLSLVVNRDYQYNLKIRTTNIL